MTRRPLYLKGEDHVASLRNDAPPRDAPISVRTHYGWIINFDFDLNHILKIESGAVPDAVVSEREVIVEHLIVEC